MSATLILSLGACQPQQSVPPLVQIETVMATPSSLRAIRASGAENAVPDSSTALAVEAAAASWPTGDEQTANQRFVVTPEQQPNSMPLHE